MCWIPARQAPRAGTLHTGRAVATASATATLLQAPARRISNRERVASENRHCVLPATMSAPAGPAHALRSFGRRPSCGLLSTANHRGMRASATGPVRPVLADLIDALPHPDSSAHPHVGPHLLPPRWDARISSRPHRGGIGFLALVVTHGISASGRICRGHASVEDANRRSLCQVLVGYLTRAQRCLRQRHRQFLRTLSRLVTVGANPQIQDCKRATVLILSVHPIRHSFLFRLSVGAGHSLLSTPASSTCRRRSRR